MFTRIGSAALKPDLTNTIALMEALGNPHQQLRCIHVAGTNGKGSTSHMLASILQEAGFRVGLYTSPHLRDFRERIRVNGKMIPQDEVVDFVARHKSLFASIQPSFFEWTVALCFDYFKRQHLDIAVIETGLGGRLDSTNTVSPMLSVITNIGWDHTDLLGDTLPKIAFEKAGIIKPQTPVVIGEYHEDTFPVFFEKARECNSKLIPAHQQVNILYFNNSATNAAFDVQFQSGEYWKNVYCDLTGDYQKKNLATVLTCLDPLREKGLRISEEAVRNGLLHVQTNTGLSGRWQLLRQKPRVICDTGHNTDGINYVVKQLSMQRYDTLRMVFGMVRDKDITKVLQLLPKEATYYFTKANLPRALDEKDLQQQASVYGLHGKTYPTVKDALDAAIADAATNDLIFVGGSTFVVAEVV